jgi:hypothetical protein
MTTNDRVQLTRDWYDLKKGDSGTIEHVHASDVCVQWDHCPDGDLDMLTMREAREVLEVIQ